MQNIWADHFTRNMAWLGQAMAEVSPTQTLRLPSHLEPSHILSRGPHLPFRPYPPNSSASCPRGEAFGEQPTRQQHSLPAHKATQRTASPQGNITHCQPTRRHNALPAHKATQRTARDPAPLGCGARGGRERRLCGQPARASGDSAPCRLTPCTRASGRLHCRERRRRLFWHEADLLRTRRNSMSAPATARRSPLRNLGSKRANLRGSEAVGGALGAGPCVGRAGRTRAGRRGDRRHALQRQAPARAAAGAP